MVPRMKVNSSEVATAVGYNDPSYFARLFKQHTHDAIGVSPAAVAHTNTLIVGFRHGGVSFRNRCLAGRLRRCNHRRVCSEERCSGGAASPDTYGCQRTAVEGLDIPQNRGGMHYEE